MISSPFCLSLLPISILSPPCLYLSLTTSISTPHFLSSLLFDFFPLPVFIYPSASFHHHPCLYLAHFIPTPHFLSLSFYFISFPFLSSSSIPTKILPPPSLSLSSHINSYASFYFFPSSYRLSYQYPPSLIPFIVLPSFLSLIFSLSLALSLFISYPSTHPPHPLHFLSSSFSYAAFIHTLHPFFHPTYLLVLPTITPPPPPSHPLLFLITVPSLTPTPLHPPRLR